MTRIVTIALGVLATATAFAQTPAPQTSSASQDPAIEKASSLRRSPRICSPLLVTSVTRSGRSAFARALPAAAAGGARVLRYATIARISASLARDGGMTLPGTPRRIVSTTRSSVAPDAHSVVRFGPLSPFASAPWHAAHACANTVAPDAAGAVCGAADNRPRMIATTI